MIITFHFHNHFRNAMKSLPSHLIGLYFAYSRELSLCYAHKWYRAQLQHSADLLIYTLCGGFVAKLLLESNQLLPR